jgi:flagellar basal-body rod modification protein FlgD
MNNIQNDPNKSAYDGLGLGKKVEEDKVNKNDMDQEAFLTLMITQLKNQDPMAPMENGEFLGQMAQFSTVSGIQGLQESMGDMVSSFQASQTLQASSLLDRDVLIEKDNTYLKEGHNGIHGAIDLEQSASAVSVNITDMSGQLIRELPMGSSPAGMVPFKWDGLDNQGRLMPPGNYFFNAISQDSVGEPVAAKTLVSAKVQSVSMGARAEDVRLEVEGAGQIGLNDIRRIQ